MLRKTLCTLLLLMALATMQPLLAQRYTDSEERHKTILGIGPALWSPALKFEQAISNSVSLGLHGKARFIIWEGGKVEPFVRYYFTYKAPEGPYLQLKASFGAYRRSFNWDNCYYDVNGNYICNDDNGFFKSYGGGLAGGYQFLLGMNNRFALDLFGGFQYIRQEGDRYSEYNFFRRIFINFPVEIGARFGVAF